jgi:hypothetical protein
MQLARMPLKEPARRQSKPYAFGVSFIDCIRRTVAVMPDERKTQKTPVPFRTGVNVETTTIIRVYARQFLGASAGV